MVKPNQNIIHSSSFNFEYGSKASASRCNILIESIFNSQILPELEEAISKKIPEGMLIELSKLEIDIGTIDEKELSTDLASKIRISLEKALHTLSGNKKNIGSENIRYDGQETNNFLLESLEIFLVKGYFPFAMDKSFTIDDMVTKAILNHKNDFIQIIKKCGRNDNVIRRITYSLSSLVFDKILVALNPVESKWIINYRGILDYLNKENKINQFDGIEFIQTINYFILKYLLNETSPAFNKKNFSSSILKELMNSYNPDLQLFIQSVKKYQGDTSATIAVHDGLAKLQEEKTRSLSETKNQTLDIGYLLKILNAGSIDFTTVKKQFLKDELILAINESKKRDFLIERLNKTGIQLILELFYQQDVSSLLKLITSFTSAVASINTEGHSKEKALSVNKFVLFTVVYLNKNSTSKLNKEEFLTYLIYSAGLKKSKTSNSSAFKSFIHAQENIDIKKIHSLINDEQEYRKISGVTGTEVSTEQKQEKIEFLPEAKKQGLDINYLLKILNAGSIDFTTVKKQFLKDELIQAINESKKRDLLIERLNKTGIQLILELFYQQDVSSLLKLITSFTSVVASINTEGLSGEKALSINKFVLFTVIYLNKNSIRKLDKEEFITYLIYSAGLKDSKTVNSSAFKSFLYAQENIDIKKMYSLINGEQEYRKILGVTGNEILTEQKEEKIESLPEVKKQGLDINYLLKILNAGSIDFTTNKKQFLKDELIQAINESKKRDLLIERLNNTGIQLILELFYQNDVSSLLNLIATFTAAIASINTVGHSGEKALSVNKFVLFTVIYLNKNSIRKLDKEEFLMYLIYSAGLKDSKTVNSSAFKSFIQAQENIDIKKIFSLMDDERRYPEISSIQKLLSKSQSPLQTVEKEHQPNILVIEKYFTIYKRKIIGYYLDSGYLPNTYINLSWKDVQKLFSDLIQQKDDFLVALIIRNEDSKTLLNRLNLLTANKSFDVLGEYLIHFFHDEYIILLKIITEIKQHFTFAVNSRIHEKVFTLELFIIALAESSGGNLSDVFMFSALERLNNELEIDSPNSTRFLHFLFSKSGDVEDFGLVQKQYDTFKIGSKDHIQKVIEREYQFLVDKFHLLEYGDQSSNEQVQNLVKKIAFYFQVDQIVFLDIIQKKRGGLLQIYILLKYYLPQKQWAQIERSLLSRIELKIEIFQHNSDFILKKIAEPELDVVKTIENMDLGETEKLKTLLVLIISDEVLFENFIFFTKDYQIPSKLLSGSKNTQSYLNQLILFSPGSLSVGINLKFWKSVVLNFVILIFLEEQKFTAETFTKAFMNYLLLKLKAINESEKFYIIIDKLQASKSTELRELVELWQVSKMRETVLYDTDANVNYENGIDETGSQNFIKKIRYYFSVIKFYANNGFFPWWANELSFPEIIYGFNYYSKLHPNKFEEIFLQLEREEHIFETLIHKIPNSIINEFDQIISAHNPIKRMWKILLQKNNKEGKLDFKYEKKQELKFGQKESINVEQLIKKDFKDSNQLFEGLYFLDDEEILKQGFNENPKIVGQIREYLLLSPYFYFRNINPTQWRQLVYEFSFDFYGDDSSKLNTKFHKDFLKYVEEKFSNVNWVEVLTSVYQIVKTSGTKVQLVFPRGLIQLINVENFKTKERDVPVKKADVLYSEIDSGIAINVNNAGLILFWPFLTRLFEIHSLVKNGDFVDSESRNRAVYMLQYLVYNDINFPEYNLVLNKLLVGMPTAEHLLPINSLSEEEIESAKSLLNGLISNWEKVKNSTPEGIQETFLQRDGILRLEKDKAFLEVEKKGVDVLVKSIPWNISLIKLAWMEKPIHVEWI